MDAGGGGMTRVRRMAGARDLLALARRWPQRYPCLLASTRPGGPRARWDLLLAHPEGSIALQSDGRVRFEGCVRAPDVAPVRFLDALDRAFAGSSGVDDGVDLPFSGGWALYLGYELAGEVEPRLCLPRASAQIAPHALALRCPAAILVDYECGETVLVAEPGREALLDAMAGDLAAASPVPAAQTLPSLALVAPSAQRFLEGVARVQDYLAAGDVFQVNLAHAWHGRFACAPEPAEVFAALAAANPAPFAGLLQQPGWALASSSPERLLAVRGGEVETRPIAGTRPRLPGDDDVARCAELLLHPKERAEHVMLVDLERNDLGRICAPGSVRVDELMALESYAHVHHIVSNVRGRLQDGVTPGAAIAAVFPGGTITGCPKVRCMEIIAELEGAPRGAYTGALGYLDRSGAMDLNILIRTLMLAGRDVSLHTGAGIVVDSVPQRELEETHAKARGMLRALGVA